MDVRAYNREAWDRQVQNQNVWTVPVGPEVIAKARQGDFSIVLTPRKPVPRGWFPETLRGLEVLCLASGGGQQGPVLAATGARVTVFDNSPAQLDQDRLVARRDGLEIETVEGDMRDLSVFPDEHFDLIFHPCSNGFIDDIRPVWREAFRVLRPGRALLAGFINPVLYTFDMDLEKQGVLQMRYAIPYSDLTSLDEAEKARFIQHGDPLSFGHTLEDQIGGQLEAGFLLAGFYEDDWGGEQPVDRYLKTFIATRAIKPVAVGR